MQTIRFNDSYGLTQAVLQGRKTMTRRVEKALERVVEDYKKKYGEEPVIKYQEWVREGNFLRVHCKHGLLSFQTRYKLGEVVAVAQSYKDVWDIQPALLLRVGVQVGDLMKSKAWTNKLFVTHKAMPHQIKITSVRIERLQDISDEDCLKEGIEYSKYERNWFYTNDKNTEFHAPSPRNAFAALINRPGVGRKGLWQSNPFVVVYEFKLIK